LLSDQCMPMTLRVHFKYASTSNGMLSYVTNSMWNCSFRNDSVCLFPDPYIMQWASAKVAMKLNFFLFSKSEFPTSTNWVINLLTNAFRLFRPDFLSTQCCFAFAQYCFVYTQMLLHPEMCILPTTATAMFLSEFYQSLPLFPIAVQWAEI